MRAKTFAGAATLLFHENPEKFVGGAYIKVGFFVTDDDLRFQDEIHGNLFEQVEKALEILFFKYLKAYISHEGIQRVERFLFPPLALREAVLNAVVHKDYSSGVPIQISIYDDRIVLWNSGQLPQDWTLERLLSKHPSDPYNPLVASAFFRAGYIESWGRGIEKISRECGKHGISTPEYDCSMSGLMLTFRANEEHLAEASGEVPPPFGEETREETREKTREKILGLLKHDPHLTSGELAEATGITQKGVERKSWPRLF